MAVAIEFYKKKGFEGFNGCEETVKFTNFINMFDALNRKYPKKGIKKNSTDLQVFFYVFVVHVCGACLCYNL